MPKSAVLRDYINDTASYPTTRPREIWTLLQLVDWFNTHQPKSRKEPSADSNDIKPIPDRLNPVTFLLDSDYQETMDVSYAN